MKAETYAIKHDIKGLACSINTVLNAIKSRHLICEDTIFEIKVVLNELIVNAICHGNLCDDGKGAFVTLKIVYNDYLYLSVEDEGCGFQHKIDINKLEEYVEAKNKDLCEHGRGLIIVEQLCDKVKFNRCGNKVSIIKNLK